MYLSELGPTYAALHGADLDRIVGPGYSSGLSSIKELLGDCEETRLPNGSGGYILGCSQLLAWCLRHSAWIGPGLLGHLSSVTYMLKK